MLWFLLSCSVFAGSPAFRFAWLSDTHVGSTTGQEDLRAAVRDINSTTGLSFVVLSGDVTEYGSRGQLRLAKEMLSRAERFLNTGREQASRPAPAPRRAASRSCT